MRVFKSKQALRIAVVDDDTQILDAILMLLAQPRWHVVTYASGEAFLEDFRTLPLSCVILDPHLPGVNGADVVRSVRAAADIPIIGLTAQPLSPVVTDMRSAGVGTILTKPVAPDVLISQVEAALSD